MLLVAGCAHFLISLISNAAQPAFLTLIPLTIILILITLIHHNLINCAALLCSGSWPHTTPGKSCENDVQLRIRQDAEMSRGVFFFFFFPMILTQQPASWGLISMSGSCLHLNVVLSPLSPPSAPSAYSEAHANYVTSCMKENPELPRRNLIISW